MAKFGMTSSQKLAILVLCCLLSMVFYLGYNLPNRWQYALHHRALSLLAMLATGAAIAMSTMIFQTIANNRILTPSILGLDSLYLLIQTLIIFLFGSKTLLSIDPTVMFLSSTLIMVLFALGLYQLMFIREQQNLFFLLLVGIVFGTFFQSVTTFMEVLIDPNEFQIAQDIGFASFNKMNLDILWLALVILVITIFVAWKEVKYFDVLAMGRDQAVNLGVDYVKLSKKLLIIVAILTSVSTALVGPLTFLGLLVMNLTFEFMPTYKHKQLIPAAICMAMITLVVGQSLVAQVFTFNTTLSIIINFVGGVYFIYLLLRSSKKWQ